MGFVKLDVNKGPQLKETRQLKKGKHIFDMKYLFIPINVGSHYTCVVVYMEDKRICYYDSYKSTKTRLGVNAGKEKRMSILTIVLEYLKTKHSEIKGVAMPGEWKLEPTCSEIQQANTKDCGVFVCMYMDFIHDGCEFNFDPDEFTSEDMRKWITMMSLIQTHEKNMKEPDDSDGDDCIVIDSMTFSAKAKKIIMKSKWKQSFQIGVECEFNKRACIECDEGCRGGDKCKNRKIQNNGYKKVKVGDTNGKGEGLFADEDIKKGEYIIEYVGQIKYSHNGGIYNMEYSDIDLLIDGKGKKGKCIKIHQSLMQSKLYSRAMVRKRHAPHVLFHMQRHQNWNGVNVQLRLENSCGG